MTAMSAMASPFQSSPRPRSSSTCSREGAAAGGPPQEPEIQVAISRARSSSSAVLSRVRSSSTAVLGHLGRPASEAGGSILFNATLLGAVHSRSPSIAVSLEVSSAGIALRSENDGQGKLRKVWKFKDVVGWKGCPPDSATENFLLFVRSAEGATGVQRLAFQTAESEEICAACRKATGAEGPHDGQADGQQRRSEGVELDERVDSANWPKTPV